MSHTESNFFKSIDGIELIEESERLVFIKNFLIISGYSLGCFWIFEEEHQNEEAKNWQNFRSMSENNFLKTLWNFSEFHFLELHFSDFLVTKMFLRRIAILSKGRLAKVLLFLVLIQSNFQIRQWCSKIGCSENEWIGRSSPSVVSEERRDDEDKPQITCQLDS